MVFIYDPAPEATALRQAEVLLDLTEYRAVALDAEGALEYVVVQHDVVVVMSQDCDLEQDCDVRFPADREPAPAEEVELGVNTLVQVLLCDAYPEAEIQAKFDNFGSRDWRRVRQNQNERYHHFEAAAIGTAGENMIEALYLDFRKHFTVPTGFLYDRIAAGDVKRRAIVPAIYSHDLMHRFYGFQSRVAIL